MTVKLPIYLDHNATTPVDPRVLEAMLPYFTEKFGNAASRNHRFGWEAEDAVDNAREQAAALIGANAKEIVFTSGATESNNLAIKGAATMYEKAPRTAEGGRGHVVTCAIEHKAVLDPVKRLMREGYDATFIDPPRDGVVRREHVEAALRPDTILVSIMWANNEIGTINEVPETFSAVVLWRFRVASLGIQLILWTTIGLLFGALTEKSFAGTAARAPARPATR